MAQTKKLDGQLIGRCDGCGVVDVVYRHDGPHGRQDLCRDCIRYLDIKEIYEQVSADWPGPVRTVGDLDDENRFDRSEQHDRK